MQLGCARLRRHARRLRVGGDVHGDHRITRWSVGESSNAMYLQETPDQLALRAELRAYFAKIITDEVRAALDIDETTMRP